MSAEPSPGRGDALTTPTQAGRVDAACDRFEADWKAGRRPRIEDHLADADGADGPALLRELLAAELELRRRDGDRPEAGDYFGRFPGREAAVEAAFRAAGLPAGRADAGGDLLLGLLALQNNFIDRDTLLAAFDAWRSDGSGTLAQILTDRGALEPETRGLLEALARKRLEAHGGDAGRGLAGIGSSDELRDRLAGLPDADLQTTVRRLGAARRDRPPADQPVPPPAGGLRYRILRPHARGGLGEVFVARDEELNREVALKQIQPFHAHDPDSRSRFVLEAEVTGGLEHPGIVPVYGLGYHADGRPYYAMRFVKGESLKEAVGAFHRAEHPSRDPGERELAFRALLGRFVDVCNAVGYAHSRGVLHRDLKPGNVMLGPYGETLVVDWGLAKVVGRREPGGPGGGGEDSLRPSSGSGLTPTLHGQAHGTPAYMSPEQAAGRLDVLGPASDVYGLGAILYSLLCGRAPSDDPDPALALEKARAGRFPTPRQVLTSVPPALEAVCLKATALKPEDRYDSPRRLADDVEHWLADEPVSAWREPASTRLRRWAGRHRPLVAGAAGLLTAAAVALAAGAVLLGRARAESERRRVEAVTHLGRAERSYALAREAVDRLFTRVSEDRLLNLPHAAGLRRELLGSAREFYGRLVGERERDPRALADLGDAYLRLSKIDAALGATAEAIAHAEQARAVFAALVERRPGSSDHRRDLALALSQLGTLYKDSGRTAEAESAYLRVIAALETLRADHPASVEYRRLVAGGYNNLGILYTGIKRAAEAEPAYRKALEIREKLVADQPGVDQYRADLSAVYNNLGYILAGVGKTEEAASSYRKAMAIREALAAAHPEVADYRRMLVSSYTNLGNLMVLNRGEPSEAEAAFRRAAEVGERLATEQPEVPKYRNDLAVSFNNLGNILRDTGRTAEAEPVFRRAVTLQEALVKEHPKVLEYRSGLAMSRNNLGVLHAESGRPADAGACYKRALEVAEALAAENPRVAAYRSSLVVTLNYLGLLDKDAGRSAEAEATFRRALALQEALVNEHPQSIEYRTDLATTSANLGDLHLESGRTSEAEAAYLRAAQIQEAILSADAGRMEAAVGLGKCRLNLGNVAAGRGDFSAARGWYDRAVATLHDVHRLAPDVVSARSALRKALNRRAEALERLGLPAEARADRDRALELADGRVRSRPGAIEPALTLPADPFAR